MDRSRALGVLSAMGTTLLLGCASRAVPPSIDLQRTLYPGLDGLRAEQISDALDQQLVLSPPLSAGLVWLEESASGDLDGASPLSDYHRTGVIDAALGALREDPFSVVTSLPTIPSVNGTGPNERTLDALRSASARFQYPVALLLQTGTDTDGGLNVLAIGYLPLVTAPIVPGSELSVASSAELCAIDVRSAIMLGCARGRATQHARFVTPVGREKRRQELTEATLREAVEIAARDLLGQVAMRFGPPPTRAMKPMSAEW